MHFMRSVPIQALIRSASKSLHINVYWSVNCFLHVHLNIAEALGVKVIQIT